MKWPVVNPGDMVTQITILQPSVGSDISGAVAGGYTPFVTTYAKITWLRGIDTVRAGQDTAQIYGVITIVYQAGILPGFRVQTRNGTYIIQSIVNPDELNVRLDMLCLGLGVNE